MQQDRDHSGRPYDQNRDTLRSSAPSQRNTPPQNSGTPKNNEYGYNGEPLSRPPSRTASGMVRRSRADNSIQFPGPQQRESNAAQDFPRQRSRSTGQQRPQQSNLRVADGGAARSNGQKRRAGAQNAAKKTNPNRSRRAHPQNAQQRYKNQRLRPAQDQRTPARRDGRKKRKVTRATLRRRRIMRRLMAFAMLLCVIGAGVYLTMTMLFRIGSIQVQTADGVQVSEIAGYSADSIVQALGVQLEENIFSFEPGAKQAVLERQFPLLDSIKVVRDYPSTVVVQVTEAVPAYAVQNGTGWLVVSDRFKILSSESTLPEGLCTLYGGAVENTTPGEKLSFTDGTEAPIEPDASQVQSGQDTENAYIDVLLALRDKLTEYEMLGDVTRIEFADREQIAFLYQDRISVLLGTVNELDYKLECAHYVLTNTDGKGCGPTETGRLDLSHSSARNNPKSYFARGEPILPSGYVVPVKTVEPTDTDSADSTAAEESGTAVQPTEESATDEVPLTDPARMTANVDEDPM